MNLIYMKGYIICLIIDSRFLSLDSIILSVVLVTLIIIFAIGIVLATDSCVLYAIVPFLVGECNVSALINVDTIHVLMM